MPAGNDAQWGVGEHSDYGLLTILLQGDVGGLQVKTPGGWDRANVHAFSGRYGDYLLDKVGKVFPELRAQVL